HLFGKSRSGTHRARASFDPVLISFVNGSVRLLRHRRLETSCLSITLTAIYGTGTQVLHAAIPASTTVPRITTPHSGDARSRPELGPVLLLERADDRGDPLIHLFISQRPI